MTQHQAPEVTSEDREAAADLYQTVHAPDENPQDIRIADSIRKGNNDHWSWVKAFAAHRTRATQPLSLTVEEGVREAVEPFVAALDEWDDEVSHPDERSLWDHPLAMNITLGDFRRAKALLDRLQSLSLPVAGEQIAENANCSGDIDRSGLAQEVE